MTILSPNAYGYCVFRGSRPVSPPLTPELEVRIGPDYAELPPLYQSVDAFLKGQHVPADVVYKTHLALEEMCTNIVKYGYDDKEVHEIVIALNLAPGQLTIRIEDDGHEFDPLAADAPDLDRPLAERPIGGLGIHLVKRSMTSISYSRKGERNTLEMVLRYEPIKK